jgi:hypothetical protein
VPSPTSPRRSPLVFGLGLAAVIVVAIGAVIGLTSGDDPADDDAGGAVSSSPGDAAGAPVAQPLGEECQNLHAGHGIAMWNSAMADEMTTAGCTFPYAPFDPPLAGGQEDPTIAAPFEPRLYDELWQVFSGLGLGVCQVATLAEESVDGYAFGFRYAVGPAGCPDLDGDAAVVAREYVTRAHRDAHADAAASPTTLVLGRWVLQVEGAPGQVAELMAGLRGIGAVPVHGE